MCEHEHRGNTARKRARPAIEQLEGRCLLSANGPVATAPTTGRSADTLSSHEKSATPASTHTATFASQTSHALEQAIFAHTAVPPHSSVFQQFANQLYGSNPPTTREIKRESFTAQFVANYTIGPPRFSDRASTIHAITSGDDAVSNQFLKGKAQLVLFPPANPNAAPNFGNPYANQVTGEATLFPENYLQTGSILILDLNGPASSEVNGLPTQMTWNYDGASGGAYTGVAGFLQALGTVDLKWFPDAHPQPGTWGSGQVLVKFQGLINNSQIVNGVAKIYS